MLGAEVWVKLVHADQPAPTDPAALTFLTMTTKPSFCSSPQEADFKPGEGGKTVVSMARWVNTWGARRNRAVVGGHDGDGGGIAHVGVTAALRVFTLGGTMSSGREPSG
jgi:hypothetical protein